MPNCAQELLGRITQVRRTRRWSSTKRRPRPPDPVKSDATLDGQAVMSTTRTGETWRVSDAGRVISRRTWRPTRGTEPWSRPMWGEAASGRARRNWPPLFRFALLFTRSGLEAPRRAESGRDLRARRSSRGHAVTFADGTEPARQQREAAASPAGQRGGRRAHRRDPERPDPALVGRGSRRGHDGRPRCLHEV